MDMETIYAIIAITILSEATLPSNEIGGGFAVGILRN